MHFKKLELFGFKSFAEKTKLHFGPGVTVIVGPNGCGKSNLVDSIKWVLGEQSPKALRGSRMEDVIFNGTDQRPSLGMAEISLTLANPSRLLPIDYEEVTVTRQIFRSGQSLYFLNKTPCRLKDIVELFMGTGVGTNAYSLLEQGQIDLILSSRPEDRRFIFEEAAGITKYKAKKKEALNKLEQTETNLVRLSDIIAEVQRQINSIERQAKKAQRYKEEFETLKDLETKVAKIEYEKIKDQLTSAREGGRGLAEKERSLRSEIAGLQSQIGLFRQELETIELESAAKQREDADLAGSIDRSNHLISISEERIEELKLQRENLDREMEHTTRKISGLKEQLEQARQRMTSLSHEQKKDAELLDEKEKRLGEVSNQIKSSQMVISRSKDQIIPLASEVAKSKNEFARIATDLQTLLARRRRLELEKAKGRKELEESSKEVQRVSSELDLGKERLANLRSERDLIRSKMGSIFAALSSLSQGLLNRRNAINLKVSKRDLFLDLKRNYVGFKQGPKSLLMAREKGVPELKGVIGPICDLIRVRPGYETVVEAAMGDQLQTIVVDSIRCAEDAISYLKSNDLGRATFLCQDSVRHAGERSRQSPGASGFIGGAIDFVETDPKFRNTISYLLENTWVVENLSTALKANLKGCRLVTLEGEVVDPGGEVTGGSKIKGDGGSLIGRDLKIEKLAKEIDQLKVDLAQDEQKEKTMKAELEELKQKVEEADGKLHNEELSLAGLKNELLSLEALNGKLGEEMGLLDLELEEVSEGIKELETNQASWERRLKDAQSKETEVQDLITSSQDAIVSFRTEKEELRVEIARIQTELVSFKENEESFQSSLERLQASLDDEVNLLNSKEDQIRASLRREEELLGEIRDLRAQIQDLSKTKVMVVEAILEFQANRKKQKEKIDQEEAELRGRQNQLENLSNDLHLAQVNQTGLSFKADAVRDRISQTYKLDLDGISTPTDEVIDLDKINGKIAEVRSRVERLGPVNLGAIEEHEELRERLEFLTNQQRDLETAKQDLHGAIRKISRTTRELFLDTFSKIQVAFREFIGLLFEGGDGRLILTDDEILECGIEIVIQPPGKRLQNISLLSGGEKALAACGLLFAIFKIKPSPFCVLDEVDGTLDEANIDRFVRVLKDFVKTSQFIIITHNKKTITMADVMYGVTMEESGISKLVGVKLTDREPQEVSVEGKIEEKIG